MAFASPKKDAVSHENGKERALTVVIKSREAAVVDVGDRGLSHGDARVVNAPLYDEDGKHKVGRIDVYCVTTDPADEPEEEASMAECFLTYTLRGGEIDTQSVTAFPVRSFFAELQRPHAGGLAPKFDPAAELRAINKARAAAIRLRPSECCQSGAEFASYDLLTQAAHTQEALLGKQSDEPSSTPPSDAHWERHN